MKQMHRLISGSRFQGQRATQRLAYFLVAAGTFLQGLCSGPTLSWTTEPEVVHLQQLIANGQPSEALARLAAEMERDPNNPRVAYDCGIAAYAAGKFEEALLSFDRAESEGRGSLIRQARFEKGNTEFQVGREAASVNLDDTISHWKESLRNYDAVLKDGRHPMAQSNREFVRHQLLQLLLSAGKTNLQSGLQPNLAPAQKIDPFRNAFGKYTEALEVAPENPDAKSGEQASRNLLADALAREGSRKAQNVRYIAPGPREAPILRPDFKDIEEGVGMLEDAHQLKPADANIERALEEAKRRMAQAMTDHAQHMLDLEPRIPQPREKLAVLRMAKEFVEKALNKVPDHAPAKKTLEEINRRLADVMEDQGDELSQQSDQANLEQQTQMLSQSLDFYQQAGELKPTDTGLPKKAEQTQNKLVQSLDKLANQLMQSQGPKESLESQAARLEGAEQALNELQSLSPSQETAGKAESVGQQLDGIRQKLAQQAQKSGQPGQQPGQQPNQPSPSQMSQNGIPLDAPPRVNTPGARGPWNSAAMNKAQDY
jgi:tetratricopeptide (TPR) repeat protein